MKITYIVGIFPKLSETFVLSQITGLIDRGHEIEIISVTKPNEETVHEDVLKYNLLEKTQYISRRTSSPSFELNDRLVSSLIFTDLIHAHFASGPTDWALKISKMFDIPFIFTAHAYDIFISPDVNKLREKFDMATKVITVSTYNKEYLLNLLGRDLSGKIEIIRYGIDLSTFKYVERKPKDTVKILLVGRLVEKKGIPYAIEAFNDVVKEYQNAELRIIGDGPLKEDIVYLINRRNLKEKVLMLGSQPRSRVSKEMEEADIFLLPSITADNGDSEGVPNGILEAQATALPVVSTLHTGIPEGVLNGKSGFLVPEKDTHAMAERLKELIESPELRNNMGKEGRKYVEVNYNHKNKIDGLENLFKDLFKEKPLISNMPKEQMETIKQRVKNIGNQLNVMGGEIKQRDGEIRQRDGEIRQKDEKIRKLQAYIDKIQNTLAYKIYARTITPFKKLLK